MKKIISLAVGLLIGFTIIAQDEFIMTERNLSGFNSITLNCSADVYIVQSNDFKVKVETEKKNQEKITTIIQNNTLIIDVDAKIFRSKKLRVFIQLQELELIINNGSGDFENKSTLKLNNFVYKGNGSGDINFKDVLIKKLNVKNNGSGDIVFKGTLNDIDIELNGSGDFYASNIIAKNCGVYITGSGDVKIEGISKDFKLVQTGSGDFEGNLFSTDNAIVVSKGSGDAILKVKKDINLQSTGSGDFTLKGNPAKEIINTNGSGDLIRR